MSGFLTVWDKDAQMPREVPASEAIAVGLPAIVWDEDKEEHLLVSAAALAAGMLRHAATLPAGSVHRAEVERQAIEITGHPNAPGWKKRKQAAGRPGGGGPACP